MVEGSAARCLERGCEGGIRDKLQIGCRRGQGDKGLREQRQAARHKACAITTQPQTGTGTGTGKATLS